MGIAACVSNDERLTMTIVRDDELGGSYLMALPEGGGSMMMIPGG